MRLHFSLIFLFLFSVGFSQKQELDAIINVAAYSIKYPSVWKIDTTGRNGTAFYLFANKEGRNEIFGENVNLLIQDLQGMHLDLKQYTEISENQIKSFGTIIESKLITRNSIEGQSVIYEGTFKDYHLKFRQYYFLKNDKAYILTYTAKSDTYDSYIETAEAIMATFVIK